MTLDRRRLAGLVRPRASRGQGLVALLCGVLGFGLAVQVRASVADPRPAARSEDLVRILADLTTRSDRLRAEIDVLRATRDRLASGTDAAGAALAETLRRERALGVLAGTAPAAGPGLTLTLADPAGSVRAGVVLDAVEELRAAGAEALQIAGAVPTRAVRIVAATWFADAPGGGLVVGGLATLRPPYVLTAVGDPQTLDAAVRIPGGVLDAVSAVGGRASTARTPAAQVTALHALRSPRYARPAATPTASPGG